MPLSWNEIKDRARRFSREWAAEASEDAEAKSFWDAFFHVFGVTRRRVATFERKVKKIDARAAFPDSTLADLYDPVSMPPALVKAHQQLDRAVDAAYIAAEKAVDRKAPKLGSDAERVAHLFALYQRLTELVAADAGARPRKRGRCRT